MTVRVYAFKKGTAETYRKSECVVFTVNGQTQALQKSDFLRRPKVGLSYIADSVLVVVDCTRCSKRALEDLFMNSRDRLRSGELRNKIEDVLMDLLKNHAGLRSLKEKRRREDLEAKLDDSKPLADVLESIIKQSPMLANLFLSGKRVSNPFKAEKVKNREGKFKGKKHPTYFKFKDLDYGKTLEKECHINMRCRCAFETNVENEYFDRADHPGSFSLIHESGDEEQALDTYVLNLRNGIASLTISLPEGASKNSRLVLKTIVDDQVILDPFINTIDLKVIDAATSTGGKGPRKKPPGKDKGKDREIPSGIAMPNIRDVHENEYDHYDFNKYTGLMIRNAGEESDIDKGPEEKIIYDFFVNIDNVYLKAELKANYEDAEVIRARFRYGLVLIGLAIIQDVSHSRQIQESSDVDEEEPMNAEDYVLETTRKVAPILLPMIENLGGLNTVDFEE